VCNLNSAGVNIIGEWTDLSGSGGYLVFETDKPDYVWTMAKVGLAVKEELQR
jgi:hypothetical protein